MANKGKEIVPLGIRGAVFGNGEFKREATGAAEKKLDREGG